TLKAEAPASKAEPTTPKPSAALEPAPAFAAAAPPPAEGPAWKTPVGLGLGAAGLLAGVVGGYFQLQADERWRDFNLHYAGGSAPAKDVLGQVSALRQQAESHQTIARATFVASGAALAGGVVLLLLDAEWERPGSGVAVKVSATPSSVGVNVRFP
ncbi:MAG TPA: hypothetical protein VK420_21475, partial [Longimicrobium sp.]|nr:hypothetical protein [Longimicrobium sp.]